MRLLEQALRLARPRIALEPRQCERIVDVVDRALDQRLDALAHQSGVGTEHEHDRLSGVRLGDEAFDLGGLESNHCCMRDKRASASLPGLTRQSILVAIRYASKM